MKLIAKRTECITQPQLEENERLITGVYQTIIDWLVVAKWSENGYVLHVFVSRKCIHCSQLKILFSYQCPSSL
jgi:hypothetical protein